MGLPPKGGWVDQSSSRLRRPYVCGGGVFVDVLARVAACARHGRDPGADSRGPAAPGSPVPVGRGPAAGRAPRAVVLAGPRERGGVPVFPAEIYAFNMCI